MVSAMSDPDELNQSPLAYAGAADEARISER
jgi:hypothetical protein